VDNNYAKNAVLNAKPAKIHLVVAFNVKETELILPAVIVRMRLMRITKATFAQLANFPVKLVLEGPNHVTFVLEIELNLYALALKELMK
jgi:hypothetical protein